MQLTWLAHSGFRLEIGDQILLIDPWLAGNPMFPEDRRADAIKGATHILLSHGHSDHVTGAAGIAQDLGIPVVGIFELATYLQETAGIMTIGFNKGGTVHLGDVSVTMVTAVHSSSFGSVHGPVYAGGEAGFMIAQGGRTIYFSGDTDVTMDMELFEALHHPEIGILSSGGFYTMDMRRAAYAARRFFNFKTVIPCHYRTFPALEQSAKVLQEGLPGVNVIEPEVLVPITL